MTRYITGLLPLRPHLLGQFAQLLRYSRGVLTGLNLDLTECVFAELEPQRVHARIRLGDAGALKFHVAILSAIVVAMIIAVRVSSAFQAYAPDVETALRVA